MFKIKRKFLYVLAVVLSALLVIVMGFTSSRPDYKNIAYTIDGQSVALRDGVSEIQQENSSAKVVTRFLGNVAKGDLNADGIVDLAFILTRQGGGSGTFYYLVGAVQNADNSYNGSDGVLLGDRIIPRTVEIRGGIVVVTILDRNPTEPMATSPSIEKSFHFKLDPESRQFGIVAHDFEGERGSPQTPLDVAPISVSLSGVYVCLPFIDPAEPQTEECIFGLKSDAGDYYMVNFGQSELAMKQFLSGARISAEGFVIVKEALSTNQWQKYNMKGIFTITKLLKSSVQ